nr:hypothetical protein [uncultured Dyadobacter sp.]
MKTKHLAYYLIVLCLSILSCKHQASEEPDFSIASNLLSSYESTNDSVLNVKRHWVIEKTGVNKVSVVETIVDVNDNAKSFKRTYQDVAVRKESGTYRLEFEHSTIDTPGQQILLGFATLDPVEPNLLRAQILIQDLKTRSLVDHNEYGIALKKI